MKLIDLINELEGAGLIITDMEEVESELERLGVDSDMAIPQNWGEDRELDPNDESQCLDCLRDFSECECDNDLP
jgi:hypothetical protein